MTGESYEYYLASRLSATQLEFLSDHYEGMRPIVTGPRCPPNESRTRTAMLMRGLVKLEPPMHLTSRSTHTVITKKGHAVMCAALGLLADKLSEKDEQNARKLVEKYGYGCHRDSAGHGDPRDGKLANRLSSRPIERSRLLAVSNPVRVSGSLDQQIPHERNLDGAHPVAKRAT